MDDNERYRSGADARRKVLGAAWVDRADANKTAFNAEWQDFITRCAWGEVWTRPHFDERTRRILVIGTMMAIGRWEEFRMHVRAALVEGGFSADDLKEIILQQAIYCGVPVGNHAFREAAEVLGRGWQALAPSPRAGASSVQAASRVGDELMPRTMMTMQQGISNSSAMQEKVEVSEKDAFNPWEQWRCHAGGGTAHATLCSGRVAIDWRYRIWKKKFVMQDCV